MIQYKWSVLCVFLVLCDFGQSGCPFQNPFWFVEKPVVGTVTDANGNLVPNKIRVIWGRMENFACVDYFQVEYFQRSNPSATHKMTPRINRHRRSVEIEVMPCTEYFFKVIASEDWKGMREDFKMFSEVVSFKLDYNPRFINPPSVKERKRTVLTPEQQRAALREQLRAQRERQRKRQYNVYGQMISDDNMEISTEPPEDTFFIKVTWKLNDIDYPICLDYFMLDYWDTLYNETGFSRTFQRPFQTPKFELEVANNIVPCEQDYEFIIKVFGLNGRYTKSYWTPPNCIVTTPPPTTTSTTEATSDSTTTRVTTEDYSAQMYEIQKENEKLKAKISGLKQEYEKIGLQVFHSFKESFFEARKDMKHTNLENFLARRKSEVGESNGARTYSNTEAPYATEYSYNTTTEESSLFG